MSDRERRNERTVHQLFEDVLNGQKYERVSDYCLGDVQLHRPGGVVISGTDAYEDHYRDLHRRLSDFQATLSDVVVDAECVATRFSVTGTHHGELLGVPATGTRVEFSAQILFRFADGHVGEEFHLSDRATLREQLQGRGTR
jgi:predicted ester cyclase